MAAVVIAFNAGGSPPRPWQNHELAELYRVVDLLGKAGLAVETDLGMSDEGDPWFVFCRADTGEPVVHFARIGGQYIAAGLDIDQTYYGSNFRDIIDQLIGSQPLMVPRAAGRGNLFLHPAAVLTAFVATALLYSHHAEAADIAGSAIHVTMGGDPIGNDGTAPKGTRQGLPGLLAGDSPKPAPATQNGSAANQAGASEPGISLASLMAAAIAAIVPLVEEDNAPSQAPATDGNAGTAVAPAGDNAPIDTPAIAASNSGNETSRLALPPLDTDPHRAPPAAGQADSASPLTLPPAPAVQHVAAAPVQAPSPVILAAHVGEPGQAHPPFHAPSGPQNGSSAETGGNHQYTLSDIDPLAIQALHLANEGTRSSGGGDSAHATGTGTAGSSGSAPSTADAPGTTGTPSTANTPSTASTADTATPPSTAATPSAAATPGTASTPGAATTPGAVPTDGDSHAAPTNTVIDGSSATTVISTLSDFIFSGQHPLTGHFQPSGYLSFAVSAYSAINGDNLRLLVFTSKDLPFPVFPFVKGVLFVEEDQLVQDTSTIHPTNTVTIDLPQGETLTLIGVVTANSAHPLNSFA